MDLQKHYGMDLHELKALCDLLMVIDPFPLNYNKQQILEEFADRKANELGFNGWIEAFHNIKYK